MADPKTPKQLSEDSVFDEFTQYGNIYVDNNFTAESTPATSPVTGEALEFGVNAFDNHNGNNTVPVAPEDGHAAIVTNDHRGFANTDGNQMFFGASGRAYDVFVSDACLLES